MNLSDITVTGIDDVLLVHSVKNRCDRMQDRSCYGLTFCQNGKITYEKDKKEYVSTPHTAVFLPMGATYTIHRNETGDFPVINFTANRFTDDFLVIHLKDNDPYIRHFHKMHMLKFKPDNQLEMLSLFYHILHILSCEEAKSVNPLNVCVEYMENHFSRTDICNHQLAEMCHISEVYLRKLFLKYYHTTPRQYLLGIRMLHAERLLEGYTLSIGEIAEQCGYTSVYHFCRSFKGVHQMTPTQYRTQKQQSLI